MSAERDAYQASVDFNSLMDSLDYDGKVVWVKADIARMDAELDSDRCTAHSHD